MNVFAKIVCFPFQKTMSNSCFHFDEAFWQTGPSPDRLSWSDYVVCELGNQNNELKEAKSVELKGNEEKH